jgi:hypothetical protein
MTNKLEVSFNSPQCGWMSIGFAGDCNEFHTTTAHAPHERALPELLKILTALLDTDSAKNQFTLRWNRNPEEFDFHFVRNADNLLLEIYQYPGAERQPAERERVFVHEGKTEDVCQAFGETFIQLYEDKDTDEFEFNWRQPFPFAEYEKFTKALAAK